MKTITVPLIALVLHFIGVIGQEASDYGADVSFPIHHKEMKDGPLGDRQKIYEDFMEGCRKFYGRKGNRCDMGDDGRLAMSRRQAQSMVVSYLVRAPGLWLTQSTACLTLSLFVCRTILPPVS